MCLGFASCTAEIQYLTHSTCLSFVLNRDTLIFIPKVSCSLSTLGYHQTFPWHTAIIANETKFICTYHFDGVSKGWKRPRTDLQSVTLPWSNTNDHYLQDASFTSQRFCTVLRCGYDVWHFKMFELYVVFLHFFFFLSSGSLLPALRKVLPWKMREPMLL